jgi:uncharacterized protein (DUF1697 family)
MAGAVVLLRGINVGGHRRVPMAELRELAHELGLINPRTYVASGNLVFETDIRPEDVASDLEHAIEQRFGFPVDVIARSAADWRAYVQSNPFPQAARAMPKWVWMFLSKEMAREQAMEELADAAPDLRVERAGDAIWIHMPDGVSKAMLRIKWDRVIGSPSTSRNWRTVETIGRMLGEDQIE